MNMRKNEETFAELIGALPEGQNYRSGIGISGFGECCGEFRD